MLHNLSNHAKGVDHAIACNQSDVPRLRRVDPEYRYRARIQAHRAFAILGNLRHERAVRSARVIGWRVNAAAAILQRKQDQPDAIYAFARPSLMPERYADVRSRRLDQVPDASRSIPGWSG